MLIILVLLSYLQGEEGVYFKFDPSPMVLSVTPPLGPRNGGSLISMRGIGFLPSPEMWCVFGGIEVPATAKLMNQDAGAEYDIEVQCITPSHPTALVAATIRSVNGSSVTSRYVFIYVDEL